MSKFPITINGAEQLRAELHRLKTVERPSVIVNGLASRAHHRGERGDHLPPKSVQGCMYLCSLGSFFDSVNCFSGRSLAR